MFPFPNDFWRKKHPENGFKLHFGPSTFPKDILGQRIDPIKGGWNDLDGFSVMPTIVTFFKGLTEEHLDQRHLIQTIDSIL